MERENSMADNIHLDYIRERMDTIVDRVAEVGKSVESTRLTIEGHIRKEDVQERELARMADTLDKNTSSLSEHIRRTDILEAYVKAVDARLTPLEMEQLRRRAVNNWITSKLKLAAKIGAAVSALGALGLAAKQLLLYFSVLR
jgi:hypothetical protein